MHFESVVMQPQVLMTNFRINQWAPSPSGAPVAPQWCKNLWRSMELWFYKEALFPSKH